MRPWIFCLTDWLAGLLACCGGGGRLEDFPSLAGSLLALRALLQHHAPAAKKVREEADAAAAAASMTDTLTSLVCLSCLPCVCGGSMFV